MVRGEKVSVVADITSDWPEECINKLADLLNELQASVSGCIKAVYLVKPRGKELFSNGLSVFRPSGSSTLQHEIIRVDSRKELYNFIDREQLTVDYGGSFKYNHRAAIEFYKTYIPVLKMAGGLLYSLANLVYTLQTLQVDFATLQEFDESRVEDKVFKFNNVISDLEIEKKIEDYQETLEKLEHPDFDPILMKIDKQVILQSAKELSINCERLQQVNIMVGEKFDHVQKMAGKFGLLKDCHDNTNEVLETIDLLVQQTENLTINGSNASEAYSLRQQFVTDILGPTKEIMDCSASILEDLAIDSNKSEHLYAIAKDISNNLTENLHPFTDKINKLNELYTRIHLFHVIFEKTNRWGKKVTKFLNNAFSCLQHEDIQCYFVVLPSNWETLLQVFYHKHPPPLRTHLHLLDQFVPEGIHIDHRIQAETLAERVSFILHMLEKDNIKKEDIVTIKSWALGDTMTSLEVSLV
ncbi:uncharacterized protein LOC128230191 isoform X2 [Mya arenaria]|nr:uncharacterized protein LOC128230191 isoform X2 [Mya arenaria]